MSEGALQIAAFKTEMAMPAGQLKNMFLELKEELTHHTFFHEPYHSDAELLVFCQRLWSQKLQARHDTQLAQYLKDGIDYKPLEHELTLHDPYFKAVLTPHPLTVDDGC